MEKQSYEDLLRKIIREVFQSDDMIDYLCQNLSLLDKRQIVDIVRKAFIPMERKLGFFEELVVFEDKEELEVELIQAREDNDAFGEEWTKKYSYTYQAFALKEALKQLKMSNKEEGVLLLQEYVTSDGVEQIIGSVPFFTYENVGIYIKSCMEEASEKSNTCVNWYVIEMYKELEDGKLSLQYTYYVFDGRLIYFVDENSDVDSGIWNKDLNIPIPFSPGDIVVSDGKSTCEDVRAVILRIGDNVDCCSLVGLCKRKDGTVESVPVKHSNMFYEADSIIMVSPLYSMKRANQQIREEEPELLKISNFISGDEDRGYIVECNLWDSMPVTDVTDMFVERLEQEYQTWLEKYGKRIE